MLSPIFKRFVQFLDEFPEIGPRQAWRLLFWFLRSDGKFQKSFVEILQTIKEKTGFCQICFFPTIADSTRPACEICSGSKRDKSILCIVARETDLITIETIKKYQGLYFVLGGLILPYEDKKIIKDRIKNLEDRIKQDKNLKQIILALPYTREAEPTIKEIEKILNKCPHLKILRPKRGIPLGGEIEFLDSETLTEALQL
jgi:recombination protein RecR